ncbi:hypothetical protein [Sulfuricella sp. T08]|uniref:KUP/HAK/KT family potassium transporter n=1 Tax=Sulfuricella sp. T08 TaxID=1632857 RepID=UPI0035287A31
MLGLGNIASRPILFARTSLICAQYGLFFDTMATSFFLGRETLIPRLCSEIPLWREQLFIAMFHNAGSAASFFKIPPNRVVEMKTQVVL